MRRRVDANGLVPAVPGTQPQADRVTLASCHIAGHDSDAAQCGRTSDEWRTSEMDHAGVTAGDGPSAILHRLPARKLCLNRSVHAAVVASILDFLGLLCHHS